MSVTPRIDDLNKRYEENPRRFFAPLANEYRKAGDLDQAIHLCQMHLAEQPANMNGHVVYGQALYEAGRMEEAKETFATAVSLDPENLIALRHLGDIARGNGDTAGARDWFRRVLDADPRNEEIIAFLAEIDAAASIEATRRTPPIPMPAVESFSSAKTVEIVPPQRHTYEEATPIVGFETVEPPVPPAPRASQALMDLPADFGSPWSEETTSAAQPAVADAAPADLSSFGDVTIGESTDAADDSSPFFSPVDQRIELEALTFAPPPLHVEEVTFLQEPEPPADVWSAPPPEPAAPADDFGMISFDSPGVVTEPVDQRDAITLAFEAPTIPRSPATEPGPQPTAPTDPVIEPLVDPVVEPLLDPVVEPLIDPVVEPMVDPVVEPLVDPVVEPLTDPVGPPVGDTPPAFVTETMATLYLQQGFHDEALAVYRQLAALQPGDDRLQGKVRELTMRAALHTGENSTRVSIPMAAVTTLDSITEQPAAPAPVAAAGISARTFFAAFAARSTASSSAGVEAVPPPALDEPVPAASSALAALFSAAAPSASDELAARAFAQAFQ